MTSIDFSLKALETRNLETRNLETMYRTLFLQSNTSLYNERIAFANKYPEQFDSFINIKNNEAQGVQHIMALDGVDVLVKKFIKMNAFDVPLKNNQLGIPLAYAFVNDEGLSPEYYCSDDDYSDHYNHIENLRYKCFKMLLKAGTSHRHRNCLNSLLTCSFVQYHPKHIKRLLLKYGADPNIRDHGMTCLYMCSLDDLKLLLKYGVDLNIPVDDFYDETPLEHFINRASGRRDDDNIKCIKLILNHFMY